MKALLRKGATTAASPTRASISQAAGGGGGGAAGSGGAGSSVGALMDVLKAEKSAEKRLVQASDRVLNEIDEALAAVLREAPPAASAEIRDTFDRLSLRAKAATAGLVTVESEANREKLRSQSALFESRLETMRKASLLQMRNKEVEMQAAHQKAMLEQARALEAKLLEGADGYMRELKEAVESLSEELRVGEAHQRASDAHLATVLVALADADDETSSLEARAAGNDASQVHNQILLESAREETRQLQEQLEEAERAQEVAAATASLLEEAERTVAAAQAELAEERAQMAGKLAAEREAAAAEARRLAVELEALQTASKYAAAEAAREVEEANARHAAELKELADEKAEMAADIADLREEVQSGKKAALTAAAEVGKARATCAALEARMEEMVREAAQASEETARLRADLVEVEARLAAAKEESAAELKAARQQATNAEVALGEANAARCEAEAARDDAIAARDSAEAELKEVHENATIAEAARDEAVAAVNAAREKAADAEAEHRAEVERMQQDLSQAEQLGARDAQIALQTVAQDAAQVATQAAAQATQLAALQTTAQLLGMTATQVITKGTSKDAVQETTLAATQKAAAIAAAAAIPHATLMKAKEEAQAALAVSEASVRELRAELASVRTELRETQLGGGKIVAAARDEIELCQEALARVSVALPRTAAASTQENASFTTEIALAAQQQLGFHLAQSLAALRGPELTVKPLQRRTGSLPALLSPAVVSSDKPRRHWRSSAQVPLERAPLQAHLPRHPPQAHRQRLDASASRGLSATFERTRLGILLDPAEAHRHEQHVDDQRDAEARERDWVERVMEGAFEGKALSRPSRFVVVGR